MKMAAAATSERKTGGPKSPTKPVSPEMYPSVPVSSQSEAATISKTKIPARNTRRCSNPGHRVGKLGSVNSPAARADSDRRLDSSIKRKSVIDRHPDVKIPGCPVFLKKGCYRFRLPRITSNAPESSASALTPEDGSISGATAAMAAPDIPIASNNIPNAFTYTSRLFRFTFSPSNSRRVPPQDGDGGRVTAIQLPRVREA